MASQHPRQVEKGRSTRQILLDIILLVAIPTVLIIIISKIWK